MTRWDDNTLFLAIAILATGVALLMGVIVAIYVGIWKGLLTFIGIAFLFGGLEAVGILTADRE